MHAGQNNGEANLDRRLYMGISPSMPGWHTDIGVTTPSVPITWVIHILEMREINVIPMSVLQSQKL